MSELEGKQRSANGTVGKSDLGRIYDRLGENETEIASLKTELKGVKDLVTQAIQEIKGLTVATNRGTDWNALAAWGVVILMLGGFIGNLAIGHIREQARENRLEIMELSRELSRMEERSAWLIHTQTGQFPHRAPGQGSG